MIGVAAGLVQALGLVRWPFAVPELARRYLAAPDGPDGEATRRTVEVTFATLHRLLGVGIGEHLGYLLTGLWTLLVAASILSTAVLPAWLGIVGLPIGVALLVGTLEFVGPNEQDGWLARGHDRAHRLRRVVGLARRARYPPAPLGLVSTSAGRGRNLRSGDDQGTERPVCPIDGTMPAWVRVGGEGRLSGCESPP